MGKTMDLKTQELSKIDQIRCLLWLGHIAVMVGAGFSKNAIRIDDASTRPPDWRGVAIRLAQELYPDGDAESIVLEKTPLSLAEEFVALRGRDALDAFLRECIVNSSRIGCV